MDGAGEPIPLKNIELQTGLKTTCAYCGVGCGVVVKSDEQGAVSVKGDPNHPANLGRLCSKGSALDETVGLDNRLLTPVIDGTPSDWDAALNLVAQKFRKTIDEYGPDSVAFYVSGQLLTEDYYVANKLMKGYIGSANIDTNSRLCMASSVAGHKRAFGADTVPGQYTDLEMADLIVLVGSNLAWCHPVLFQRIVAAKKDNPKLKVVNIDPRRTATSEIADMHLALSAGSDVALFNGLLDHLERAGKIDRNFVSEHVDGFDDAMSAAQATDLTVTGLSAEVLEKFYAMWAANEKVVTIYSQGVNQSTSGADKVNAILNCHLATGRIGKPGMGPLSVTGQPNAMGGREVGGLANMLACHLDIENAEHRHAVQQFWGSPAMCREPGLKAVDMFQAVSDGKIRALWVMCTNPAVSMPEADAVRDAISKCDFVVVSDITAQTDTCELADVLLPATGWGEKDGTVTNSERCISRQRGVLPVPGQARHDWRIICDVASRMGWGRDFSFDDPAEIFREYAALSEVAGKFGKDFDISGLKNISREEFDSMEPTVWPISEAKSGGRFFADGRFFTPNGRGRMLALTPRQPQSEKTDDFPYRLNTGRVRDHWHTMTRTAKSPRLSQHMAEPYIEVHPDDASRLGLAPAALAEVTGTCGRAVLRVIVTDRLQQGDVFAPMHWTKQTAPTGRIDALVRAFTDPVSGQPESKASTVQIKPFGAAWYGFAATIQDINPTTDYWAKAATRAGWRIELADQSTPEDWESYAKELFGFPDAQVSTVIDKGRGIARVALLQEGRVCAVLFTAREPVAVTRSHVSALIGGSGGPGLLSGRPGEDQPDPGATICACFDVGVNTILNAIETQNLTTVDAIGAALQAGTNCGSCRPELAVLLAGTQTHKAAE